MAKGIDPSTLNVEFVPEGLPPKVTGDARGGPRKSKWDILVNKLQAQPGVWARVGQPGTKAPVDTGSLRKKGLEASLRSEGRDANDDPIVQLWVRFPDPNQAAADEATVKEALADDTDADELDPSEWNTESQFADD